MSELARVARQVLADAREAILHIDGVDTARAAADITLHDEDGRPLLVCPRDSPVARAAAADALAVLSLAVRPGTPPRVVLAGHLTLADQRVVDGVAVCLVELLLATVTLETAGCPDGVEVPLEDYAYSPGLAVRAYAERVRRHTNAAHPERLREVAEHYAGAPVLAASLAAVDAAGLELAWVDEHGGTSHRLPFDAPARCPRELAGKVRTALAQRPATAR